MILFKKHFPSVKYYCPLALKQNMKKNSVKQIFTRVAGVDDTGD